MKVQLGTTPEQWITTFTLDYVEILERNVNNRQEHLCLEALHSIQNQNSVKEHIHFSQVYLPIAASLGTGGKYKPQIMQMTLFKTLTKATVGC